MRALTLENLSTVSYGDALERLELVRNKLRWAARLERSEIEDLLDHCNELKDDIMLLSRKTRDRVVEAVPVEQETGTEPGKSRRQSLLERNFQFEGVFGDSPKLLETLEVAEKVAPTDLPVLIDGESGTGKELMAKVIHANGKRGHKAFVSVNCGAIPENLLESELFGHKKGAFTGAIQDRKGKFESADGGTIFLDEIGELPLIGQVKLLRVLQSQEIQRVGADETIEIDARIVAATNRDLFQMVQDGTFREDLYYRLSIIHISLPSLRERPDEIPLLLQYYSDEAAESLGSKPLKMTPSLERLLLQYRYPGNIRELRNLVYRLSCLSDGLADVKNLPAMVRKQLGLTEDEAALESIEICADLSLSDLKKRAIDQAEKQYLTRALRENGGNVAELARSIDMNRSYLQTMMKKHGLSAKDFRNHSKAQAE
ncbi:MAG: sigma 54-interacting transcriptional regulator [Methylococcaceae bacterium]|nr:sigma 54-interacting transcriptional regulator [Methylococcaceae bacterium]MCI0732800.1 sigma 54-interacting transcriptional regulator [Methylococcaceae bacterium]